MSDISHQTYEQSGESGIILIGGKKFSLYKLRSAGVFVEQINQIERRAGTSGKPLFYPMFYGSDGTVLALRNKYLFKPHPVTFEEAILVEESDPFVVPSSQRSFMGVPYLARIGSKAENDFLLELMQKYLRPGYMPDGSETWLSWLGGTDGNATYFANDFKNQSKRTIHLQQTNGSWAWLNGRPMGYRNWSLNTSVFSDSNHSLAINFSNTTDAGLWFEVDGSDEGLRLPYVLEFDDFQVEKGPYQLISVGSEKF